MVSVNPEEARKDAADREAILDALEEQLREGSKSLVGNRGYRKYLRGGRDAFAIDESRVAEDERYDGKWVLRTNTDLDAAVVARQYRQLWIVDDLLRSPKCVLEVRPVYHETEATIRGHVFCSFLALVLRSELEAIEIIDLLFQGKRCLLRTEAEGTAGKVCQAVGVTLPPTIQQLEEAPSA